MKLNFLKICIGLITSSLVFSCTKKTEDSVVLPSTPPSYYLYTGSNNSATFDVAHVMDGEGNLEDKSTTLNTGAPFIMVSNPDRKVVYALSQESVSGTYHTNIYQYLSSSTDGSLTEVATHIQETAVHIPRAAALTSDGKFLIVTGVDNSASASATTTYLVDSTTGALTLGPSITHNGGANSYSMILNPNGHYAYIFDIVNSALCTYAIDSTTGGLTLVGSCLTPSITIAAMATNTGGSVLYASGLNPGIERYSINASTGALTSIGSTTLPGSASSASRAMLHYADTLFVATNVGQISAFPISSDGTLGSPNTTTLSGYTTTSNSIESLAITPDGKYLFAANYIDAKVLSFALDSTSMVLTQSSTAYGNANTPGPYALSVIQH